LILIHTSFYACNGRTHPIHIIISYFSVITHTNHLVHILAQIPQT